MTYFDKDAKSKLTWLDLIIMEVKVDSYDVDVARADGGKIMSSSEDFL
jgi:hypothetical protein